MVKLTSARRKVCRIAGTYHLAPLLGARTGGEVVWRSATDQNVAIDDCRHGEFYSARHDRARILQFIAVPKLADAGVVVALGSTGDRRVGIQYRLRRTFKWRSDVGILPAIAVRIQRPGNTGSGIRPIPSD